jgi:hypothetical protein
MNTEHVLPSTRIAAARIAARATEERVRRMGIDPNGLPTLAANLTRIVSLEMAVMIATARAKETRHV